MKYVKRLTEPSATDKNWIHMSKGGYNKCILIKGNSCLPNCTGYAWGRWRELLGKDHNLSVNQAEVWFKKNDGYERGQTPKLGAVICYAKGDPNNYKDGAGHVAIVEEIKDDGSIIIGQSGSNSTKKFWTQTLKPPYSYGTGYTLQGFIYIPLEFEEETPITPETTSDDELLTLVKKTIRGDFGSGDKRIKALGDNYSKVQNQVNLNIKNKTTNWDNIKLY